MGTNTIRFVIASILTISCSLFAQEEDLDAPISVPMHEQLLFSEEMDPYFHEELFFDNNRASLALPPSKIRLDVLPCQDGGWRICMTFPHRVVYKEQADACTLCLEFNQELSSAEFSQVEEALQFLIQRVDTGYNTLKFSASRPLIFYTQAQDNVFMLDIYPDYTGLPFIPRNLKIARARLLIELRYFALAFCALKTLICEYPEDRDVWVLLADLEGLLPRWQRSVAILRELRGSFPYDADIQALLHDAFYPHSSYIRFEESAIRYVHQAVEHISRLSGEWILNTSPNQFFYLGGTIEERRGHIAEVVQSDGTTAGFLGNRVQGTLYMREEFSCGTVLAGRIYVTEGIGAGVGASMRWLVPCIQGEMELIMDWHRPYWDTYETFAIFGREDRIRLETNGVFSRFFDGYLNVGFHRVGIEHVTNGFSSFLANWGLNWNFYVTAITNIALHYDFDGEYVYSHARRVDVDGDTFQPVPFTTYEFHTFKCNYTRDWRCWEFVAGVGYTINRLGTDGVNVDMSLRYRHPCPCGWEFLVSGSQFPSTTVPGATEQTFNAAVTLRY